MSCVPLRRFSFVLVGLVGCSSATEYSSVDTAGGTVRFRIEEDCGSTGCAFDGIQVAGPLSAADCTGERDDLVDSARNAVAPDARFGPRVWSVSAGEGSLSSPVTYGESGEGNDVDLEAIALESGSCYAAFLTFTVSSGAAVESLYFDAP